MIFLWATCPSPLHQHYKKMCSQGNSAAKFKKYIYIYTHTHTHIYISIPIPLVTFQQERRKSSELNLTSISNYIFTQNSISKPCIAFYVLHGLIRNNLKNGYRQVDIVKLIGSYIHMIIHTG